VSRPHLDAAFEDLHRAQLALRSGRGEAGAAYLDLAAATADTKPLAFRQRLHLQQHAAIGEFDYLVSRRPAHEVARMTDGMDGRVLGHPGCRRLRTLRS
jgi:hypothetical protein